MPCNETATFIDLMKLRSFLSINSLIGSYICVFYDSIEVQLVYPIYQVSPGLSCARVRRISKVSETVAIRSRARFAPASIKSRIMLCYSSPIDELPKVKRCRKEE